MLVLLRSPQLSEFRHRTQGWSVEMDLSVIKLLPE